MMKKLKVLFYLIIFLIFTFIFQNHCVTAVNDNNIINFKVRFSIGVYELDFEDMTSKIDIKLLIYNFPIYADYFIFTIVGRDYPEIICRQIDRTPLGYIYQGEVKDINWVLDGVGDMFPHDIYKLKFSLYEHVEYEINNTRKILLKDWTYEIDSKSTYASFTGPKGWLLHDKWVSDEGLSLPVIIQNKNIEVQLMRKSFVPYLQFLVPLLFGEWLMLCTLLFYKKPNLNLLRIYMAFIAFSPLNTLAIQPFLPHRKVMSLPEFYSVIIFITSIILSLRIIGIDELIKKGISNIVLFIADFMSLLGISILYYIIFTNIYEPIKTKPILVTAKLSIDSFTFLLLIAIIWRTINFFIQEYNYAREKKVRASGGLPGS